MKLKSTVMLTAILGAVIAGQFALMNYKLLRTRKVLSKRLAAYRRDQKALTFGPNKKDYYTGALPKELGGVPYRDGDIIQEVKNIHLRNVFAPYNASLIEKGDGHFLLFYRHDVVRQMHFNTFDTYIGCAELDEHFEQTGKDVVRIETGSPHSEDPRVIKNRDDFFLVYNDGPYKDVRDRKMHIAQLDPESFQPVQITKINSHFAATEKNWAPFSYQNSIHFEYQLFTPRKVLKLDDPGSPELSHINDPLPVVNIDWENKWGTPLGGTSARLVDGQYLAFFHSKFKDDKGSYWYVMGAYTFEAEPPFRITAMSKEPLLFKGIYQSEAVNTATPYKFVIFPCGYAIKGYGERTFLHLACGENDCAVKIVTIDKDRLLKSMKEI